MGSVIITFMESLVGSYTERHLFVLGVIFIVFVMFLPDGLCGLVQRWSTRRKGAPYVVRCPAIATLPSSPGRGVLG